MGMSLMGKVSGVGKKPGSALERRYIKSCKNTIQVFNVKSRSIECKNIPRKFTLCQIHIPTIDITSNKDWSSTVLSVKSRGWDIPEKRSRAYSENGACGLLEQKADRQDPSPTEETIAKDLLFTPKRRVFQEIGSHLLRPSVTHNCARQRSHLMDVSPNLE